MGLAQQLRELDDDRLADLLLARPDLLERPPASLEQLAGRAATWASQVQCMASLDLFSHQLVELVALAGRPAAVRDVAALAGPGVRQRQVEEGLRRLHDLCLVTFDPPHVSLLGDLRNRVGTGAGIGRASRQLLPVRTVEELKSIARFHCIDVPPGRQIPKGQLVAAITDRLENLPQLVSLLTSAPDEVASLLQLLEDAGRCTIATYNATRLALRATMGHPPNPADPPDPVLWLLERGLLVETSWGTAELIAEVTLALRGGVLFPGITAEAPELRTLPLGPAVDLTAESGQAASRLLSQLTRMLHDLEADPAPALKTGGVGVRVVKRVANLTDLNERNAALLIELAAAAGLIEEFGDTVRPTDLVDDWLELEPPDRWLHVFRTWTIARSYLRAAGDRDENDKPVPPLSTLTTGFDAPLQRRTVLTALAESPANHAVDMVSLIDRLVWIRPQRWFGSPVDSDLTVAWFVDEARFIGALVLDALVPAVRLELSGDFDGARAALALGMPEPQHDVILQADMTALAMGTLDPRLARRLGQLADVESRSSATVYRFTPASLGRAMAAGSTPTDILSFLAAHSRNEIPQPLKVLVEDVGRRYGQARVGPANSYVRCDDEALLAELVRHRKLAKFGLRTIAPTVAVSSAAPDSLLGALRTAGYLPAEEDAEGIVVVAPQPQRQRARAGYLLGGPSWAPPDRVPNQANAGNGRHSSADRARADALVAALRGEATGQLQLGSPASRARLVPATRPADEVIPFPGNHDQFPSSPLADDMSQRVVLSPFSDKWAGVSKFELDEGDGLVVSDPRDYIWALLLAQRDDRTIVVMTESLDEPFATVVGYALEVTDHSVLVFCTSCDQTHDIAFSYISDIQLCSHEPRGYGIET